MILLSTWSGLIWRIIMRIFSPTRFHYQFISVLASIFPHTSLVSRNSESWVNARITTRVNWKSAGDWILSIKMKPKKEGLRDGDNVSVSVGMQTLGRLWLISSNCDGRLTLTYGERKKERKKDREREWKDRVRLPHSELTAIHLLLRFVQASNYHWNYLLL